MSTAWLTGDRSAYSTADGYNVQDHRCETKVGERLWPLMTDELKRMKAELGVAGRVYLRVDYWGGGVVELVDGARIAFDAATYPALAEYLEAWNPNESEQASPA